MSERGWRLTVFDAADEVASGASGNLASVLRPLPSIRTGAGVFTAGTAAAVGSVAGLAISAPVAIVDPHTRRNFADKTDAVGQALRDAGAGATD